MTRLQRAEQRSCRGNEPPPIDRRDNADDRMSNFFSLDVELSFIRFVAYVQIERLKYKCNIDVDCAALSSRPDALLQLLHNNAARRDA
jgi:hypothetical protein